MNICVRTDYDMYCQDIMMLLFQYHDFHLVTGKTPKKLKPKQTQNKQKFKQTNKTSKNMKARKNDHPMHIQSDRFNRDGYASTA